MIRDKNDKNKMKVIISNVPTVLFLGHEVYLMRTEAKPYLKALRGFGQKIVYVVADSIKPK